MSIHPTVNAKATLLKAFLASTLVIVLLLLLVVFGVWRYTDGILTREAILASDILPNLDIAQQLTAGASEMQANSQLLMNAATLESLNVQHSALNESIVATERIMRKASGASYTDVLPVDQLTNIGLVVDQLTDIRSQAIRLDRHFREHLAAFSADLAKLADVIQQRIIELTAQQLRVSGALSELLAGMNDSGGIDRRDNMTTFEVVTLQIQDYMLFDQELVALQALVERLPLLPTLQDVVIAEQERDLLLRSMVSRAIYIDGLDTRDLLLSPLAVIRQELRASDSLFVDRKSALSLIVTQVGLANQLLQELSAYSQVVEQSRADAQATLRATTALTLDEISRYRWSLAVLFSLAMLILGLTGYWLLYRQTVRPLVKITDQLDKVGTAQFRMATDDFFIQEMDELARAVQDLDRVQRLMQEKDIQIKRRNTELARANEDLEQFAHVASHDLQEPLRKLQQFSALLQEDYGGRLEKDGEYYLQAISDSAQRMSRMIRDTLDYARSSRNEQILESVDLENLVELLRTDLDMLVTESDAVLNVGPLPTVHANATGMSQLFRNLMVNSMKYRRTGIACEISIRCRDSEDRRSLVIEFADNGIGIPEEHLDRIFKPFERLTSTPVKGTGLGLAICQRVCDAHGWPITVVSQLGAGTCFSISIPLDHVL